MGEYTDRKLTQIDLKEKLGAGAVQSEATFFSRAPAF